MDGGSSVSSFPSNAKIRQGCPLSGSDGFLESNGLWGEIRTFSAFFGPRYPIPE